MVTEVVHIGFDNFIVINRVIAIVSVNSEPIKRTMQAAKNKQLLVDMTRGRKTKAAIFTDSGHVILAALAPETIVGRLRLGQTEGFVGKGDPLLRIEQDDEKTEL